MRPTRRDALALFGSAFAVGLLPRLARAASIQATLHDDAGWEHVSTDEKRGVTLYTKPMPALGMAAFKGVRLVDPRLSADALFIGIAKIERHAQINDTLHESIILKTEGATTDFYQVSKSPALVPIDERFWFNRARTAWNKGGVEGHHKRTWDVLGSSHFPDALASILERWPDAVEVPVTHGSWEILPTAAGLQLTYRTVSDPGGNIPTAVFESLSRRTLPDNMLGFERYALRTAGF